MQVGTAFIRGVSGGERKRVNIGMELITSPGILFLDEPTTGLDASTANTVMSILHRCVTALCCCITEKQQQQLLLLFTIHVKKRFLRFYSGHVFTFFNVFYFANVFYF